VLFLAQFSHPIDLKIQTLLFLFKFRLQILRMSDLRSLLNCFSEIGHIGAMLVTYLKLKFVIIGSKCVLVLDMISSSLRSR
jgi:hypothetical protein